MCVLRSHVDLLKFHFVIVFLFVVLVKFYLVIVFLFVMLLLFCCDWTIDAANF